MKPILAGALFLQAGGNVLYGCADFLKSKHAILIGRVLIGLGAGSNSLTNAYVVRESTKEERTKYLAIMSLCNMLAMMMGPASNLLIDKLNIKVGSSGLIINKMTGAGFLPAVLVLLLVVFLLIVFKEPKRTVDGAVALNKMPASSCKIWWMYMHHRRFLVLFCFSCTYTHLPHTHTQTSHT